MGKGYNNTAKILNRTAIIGNFNPPVSEKERIIGTEVRNSNRDDYAHKKPEIAMSGKLMKAVWNAYSYGYYNWDKMNTVEKGLYLGLVFSTATGVVLTADYLAKGFISDSAKKGAKWTGDKAGNGMKFAKEKAGKAWTDGAAFYGLLKDGSSLNAFGNASSGEKTNHKEVLTDDGGGNIEGELYGKYHLGEPKELFEYEPGELKTVNAVHPKIPSLKKIERDYEKIIYGKRVPLEDLYEDIRNSDGIVFGEVHYFNPERYNAVAELINVAKNGTKSPVIGVEGFKNDAPVKSSRLQYYTDIDSIGIPILGIENIETDELGRTRETGKAEKERFAFIASWALNKTKNGKKPIVYVGDAHATGVVEGFDEDSWKSDAPYNIRGAFVKKGFKLLVIHVRDKPVLGQIIDKKLANSYKKISSFYRNKYTEEADNLWSSIVRPWEKGNYFIKASENEYYFIISDHNLPYSTPKNSVWVNSQRKN